jgi:3-oxoadipate enol-lactonase
MTDTVKLHYTEHGAGFPVVLVHGFPFDHRIWDQQAETLSESYHVIMPDLRGHGKSPAPEGVYTMDLMARDIFALLDDLSIERAVWAGHSMGGYITMAALRLAPERIAGAAFVATHPYSDSDEKRAGRLSAADKVLAEGSQVVAESMRPIMFAPGFDLSGETAGAMADMMRATSPIGIAGAQRGMAERLDSAETLHDLSVPAVVIAGAEDQIVSLNVAKQMIAEMPSSTKLTAISDAGHMLMIEQPAATTVALREFLDAHFGS